MTGHLHRARNPLVLALVTTLVAAGCAQPEPPPPAPLMTSVRPATDPYSFVWHEPAPGVEIDGPEYTFVRAATESFYRALHHGRIEGGFPGFEQVIDQSPEIRDFIGRIGNPGTDPEMLGAYDVRVVARETVGLSERVSVCLYKDRLLVQDLDAPDHYEVGHPEGLSFNRGDLVFDKVGTAPAVDVEGPESIPTSGDVFGEWKLRDYQFNPHRPSYDSVLAEEERCQENRGNLAYVPETGETVPADSQQPIPPVPGWPGDIS